jgi:hypothetical protein
MDVKGSKAKHRSISASQVAVADAVVGWSDRLSDRQALTSVVMDGWMNECARAETFAKV